MFIAITPRLIETAQYYEIREALDSKWGEFFNKNLKGFLPLVISYEIPFNEYIKHNLIKGIILSGGNDLSTLNYNELSIKRDKYETQILEYALESNMPLLGICRGAQLIAQFFNSKLEKLENHIGVHKVVNIDDSIAFDIKSFHNYGIVNLNENLKAEFKSLDSSIEAFSHKSLNIFGQMWHIEREEKLNQYDLFYKFLNSIKDKK